MPNSNPLFNDLQTLGKFLREVNEEFTRKTQAQAESREKTPQESPFAMPLFSFNPRSTGESLAKALITHNPREAKAVYKFLQKHFAEEAGEADAYSDAQEEFGYATLNAYEELAELQEEAAEDYAALRDEILGLSDVATVEDLKKLQQYSNRVTLAKQLAEVYENASTKEELRLSFDETLKALGEHERVMMLDLLEDVDSLYHIIMVER